MFDHLGFITADADKALRFYRAAIGPLGLSLLQRHPNGAFIIGGDGDRFLYVGPDAPEFWADGHAPARSPIHLCLTAPSQQAVDAFHAAALAAGGTDNGAPGARDTNYYAAFVLDPDGNNIEAVHRSA